MAIVFGLYDRKIKRDFKKRRFELLKRGKKLHSFQIPKKVVFDLIKNFSKEQCEKQIKHLELLQSKNKIIHNKAAWLTNAIKENYLPPKEQSKQNDHQKNIHIQTLERDLNHLLADEHHDKALALAQKILSLGESIEAKKAIEFIHKQKQKMQKLEHAKKIISEDTQKTLHQKAVDKVLKMTKFSNQKPEEILAMKIYKAMIQNFFENMMINQCFS